MKIKHEPLKCPNTWLSQDPWRSAQLSTLNLDFICWTQLPCRSALTQYNVYWLTRAESKSFKSKIKPFNDYTSKNTYPVPYIPRNTGKMKGHKPHDLHTSTTFPPNFWKLSKFFFCKFPGKEWKLKMINPQPSVEKGNRPKTKELNITCTRINEMKTHKCRRALISSLSVPLVTVVSSSFYS